MGAAQQSFQDRQFDVYVGSIAVGSQALNELSLQRKIRVLGVSDELLASEAWGNFLVSAVQFGSVVGAGTYSGQANCDADLVSTASAMKKANALMRSIDASKPFAGMNATLLTGALRYHDEVGIDVPADLRG